MPHVLVGVKIQSCASTRETIEIRCSRSSQLQYRAHSCIVDAIFKQAQPQPDLKLPARRGGGRGRLAI